ncbi:uncharacterized protein BX663DRAFT_441417 [Cokeromyces recurvatus]|uniref:uncharacterized protein n=1 Tax=Cokeromyces recurvatus TaxID=90255 RepID=UPI00221E8A2B|nr:uncharacterized protein BX663DRAFT_441417 [Cokeromyces recurvatus]KAI7899365.1 hypothetical protein BX663DRAFT_441417 [Cokeromyces recurvatus]
MVQVLPINYNNEHYKSNNYEYQQQHPPPPPLHQQQMPIPMPVPMINHLMPPHHPPNFFHHPPPPPPLQAIYPADQPAGQYIDYASGYHPTMGFIPQGGYYSDITVYVPTLQKHYPLNTTILSRSPVLYQRIMEEQSNTLELDLYVLPETFHTIIGHLSRPLTPQEIMFIATEKPQMAIELLEASEELGLDPLLDALMLALNQNLTHQKTAMTYIEAMDPYQPLEGEEPRRWVETLEEYIVLFMVKSLSTQLEAFSTTIKVSGNVLIGQVNACGYMPTRTPPMRGMMDLVRAYAALPQHLMIRCLEHPELPVQDAIQRYYFAKKVLSIVAFDNRFHQRQNQPQLMAVMLFEKGLDTVAIVKQTGMKKGCWNPKLYEQLCNSV